MNNYFGLGIDAELSLDFHHAREEEPRKFTSRWVQVPDSHPIEQIVVMINGTCTYTRGQ